MPSNEEQYSLPIDVCAFVETIGLKRAAPGRYSALLVAGLLGGALSGTQNPAKIIREIELLERGEPGWLKQPIQNKYPPLKGLWHKHYMQDGLSSLAINLKHGIGRHKIPLFEQMIRDAEDAGEERFVELTDIPAIVDDIVIGNRLRLAEQQALCGEWIVFAKHDGQNYYLAVATHDSNTHQRVREQIEQVCCREFPFLSKLLTDAEKA